VEPIPESRRVLEELARTDDTTFVAALQRTADHIEQIVPACVGVSVSLFDSGLTFTFVESARRIRGVDGVRYLEDGPCTGAATDGSVATSEDLLDEGRWQIMAQVAANNGIRSSLSLPLRDANQTLGSINLYSGATEAFSNAERDLVGLFGDAVEDAVTNADLSMASRESAERGMGQLRANDQNALASGVLAQHDGITVDEAQQRIQAAAARAGIDQATLSEALLVLYLH
jgi:GAF domain-containing protein